MLGLHRDFPEECTVLGRLLAGYGELEFGLLLCLTPFMPNASAAMKLLFRARGEEQRIQIADAVIRDRIPPGTLRNRYCEAISDMGHCKTIRNQYAHCQWTPMLGGDGLAFNDLEQPAKSNSANPHVYFRPIDLTLLTKQAEYFEFVSSCFVYLNSEFEKMQGAAPDSTPTPAWPKKVARPPLHNGQP